MLSNHKNDIFRKNLYEFRKRALESDINPSDMEHLRHGKFNYPNQDKTTMLMKDYLNMTPKKGGNVQTTYKPQHVIKSKGKKTIEYDK